tara:strand:- start:164637 stop:164789 length:153 start_codon:yes stop_codon:yes gene_type:complete
MTSIDSSSNPLIMSVAIFFAGETFFKGAEGATAPETLRQPDRQEFKHSGK